MGAFLGGVIGFVAGLALSTRRKRKKALDSALSVCGPTKVGNWIQQRDGIPVLAVTSAGDLSFALPKSRGGQIDDEEFPTTTSILVQDTCSIFKWQGSAETGGWVPDPVATNDLRSFAG